MFDDVNGVCRICTTQALFAPSRGWQGSVQPDPMGRLGRPLDDFDDFDVSVAEFRPLCLLRPGQCLLPLVGTSARVLGVHLHGRYVYVDVSFFNARLVRLIKSKLMSTVTSASKVCIRAN